MPFVVHLNTSDLNGGAARAAHRLDKALQQEGTSSSMYVLRKQGEDERVRAFRHPTGWADRLARRWRAYRIEHAFEAYAATRPKGLEPFSDDRTVLADQILPQLPHAEVYNLHWIRKFVDLRAFFDGTRAPVVWTLHDMNAFTGGCHYDQRCGRFMQACGACPQLGSSDERDLSRAIWERKKALFGSLPPQRLHVVALCQWMANLVRRSPLLGRFDVTVIPNSLDVEVFAPCPPRALRHALGIPLEDYVITFVSASATNPRKGIALLAEALQGLQVEGRRVHLLSAGRNKPNLQTKHPHHHLGSLQHEALLAMAYSAGDVFVVPSRQDNLPNTVLEAMACGTPVVGFDAGGIPDMVRPGETGLLAPVGDVRALRAAIEQLLRDDTQRRHLATRCREVAVTEYAPAVQAGRYRALYTSLTGVEADAWAVPDAPTNSMSESLDPTSCRANTA